MTKNGQYTGETCVFHAFLYLECPFPFLVLITIAHYLLIFFFLFSRMRAWLQMKKLLPAAHCPCLVWYKVIFNNSLMWITHARIGWKLYEVIAWTIEFARMDVFIKFFWNRITRCISFRKFSPRINQKVAIERRNILIKSNDIDIYVYNTPHIYTYEYSRGSKSCVSLIK